MSPTPSPWPNGFGAALSEMLWKVHGSKPFFGSNVAKPNLPSDVQTSSGVVADEVHELRRLVADGIQYFVLLPRCVELARPRVLVDVAGLAGEADDEHIVPAVAVEVVDPVEEVVGVAFAVLRLRGVDFVLRLEVRPRVPVRPVHHVRLAVAVDVARVGPFGVVDVGEPLPLELVERVLLGECRRGPGHEEEQSRERPEAHGEPRREQSQNGGQNSRR